MCVWRATRSWRCGCRSSRAVGAGGAGRVAPDVVALRSRMPIPEAFKGAARHLDHFASRRHARRSVVSVPLCQQALHLRLLLDSCTWSCGITPRCVPEECWVAFCDFGCLFMNMVLWTSVSGCWCVDCGSGGAAGALGRAGSSRAPSGLGARRHSAPPRAFGVYSAARAVTCLQSCGGMVGAGIGCGR